MTDKSYIYQVPWFEDCIADDKSSAFETLLVYITYRSYQNFPSSELGSNADH